MNRSSVRWVRRGAALAVAASIAGLAAFAATAPVAAGNGSWTIDTSADPGPNGDGIFGVACPDATHCWAVGFQNPSNGPTQTLIEAWSGSAWTAQASANVTPEAGGSQRNELIAISCVSITDCWAVGYYQDTTLGHDEPLYEHWDGTSWSVPITLAAGVASDYYLQGVSCVDANDCWAVGYKDTGGTETAWIEQWNGTTWANDTDTQPGTLAEVSCADITHCKAVGISNGTQFSALIQSWNGSAWSTDTAASVETTRSSLSGVFCSSATSCWAGGAYASSGVDQILLESWNGTTWTQATTAGNHTGTNGLQSNGLNSVGCSSATSCWAVGIYRDSSTGLSSTLINKWDGTSWTLVDSPNVAKGNNNDLYGVSCGATQGTIHCAAGGDYFAGGEDPTLLMSITFTPAPTPTATPTPTPTQSTGLVVTVPDTGVVSEGGVPVGALLVVGGGLLSVAALRRWAGRRGRSVP